MAKRLQAAPGKLQGPHRLGALLGGNDWQGASLQRGAVALPSVSCGRQGPLQQLNSFKKLSCMLSLSLNHRLGTQSTTPGLATTGCGASRGPAAALRWVRWARAGVGTAQVAAPCFADGIQSHRAASARRRQHVAEPAHTLPSLPHPSCILLSFHPSPAQSYDASKPGYREYSAPKNGGWAAVKWDKPGDYWWGWNGAAGGWNGPAAAACWEETGSCGCSQPLLPTSWNCCCRCRAAPPLRPAPPGSPHGMPPASHRALPLTSHAHPHGTGTRAL